MIFKVVASDLLDATHIKYPEIRTRLLSLVDDDLTGRSKNFSEVTSANFQAMISADRARADELLMILKEIKLPRIKYLGVDGAKAAWLIAQHNSSYKDVGKNMLERMRYILYRDKKDVFYPGIPYLVDRLMLERAQWKPEGKQLYGTQFFVDDTGNQVYYPIINEKELCERLAKYGLEIDGQEGSG